MFQTSAVPVATIDTLGAGDTFISRTLIGLLRGEAPQETLWAAAEAAAETCTRMGAIGHAAPMEVDLGYIQGLKDIS